MRKLALETSRVHHLPGTINLPVHPSPSSKSTNLPPHTLRLPMTRQLQAIFRGAEASLREVTRLLPGRLANSGQVGQKERKDRLGIPPYFANSTSTATPNSKASCSSPIPPLILHPLVAQKIPARVSRQQKVQGSNPHGRNHLWRFKQVERSRGGGANDVQKSVSDPKELEATAGPSR